MYYNTNNETGDTLDKSRQATTKQDTLILETFKAEIRPLSSYEVLKVTKWPTGEPPRTSVHRALRTLEKDGLIVKLGEDQMVMGPYNKQVHRWGLAPSTSRTMTVPVTPTSKPEPQQSLFAGA